MLTASYEQPQRKYYYMADFFKKIPWWELEPFHQAITNQPEEYLKKMVLSKNGSGSFAVVYIPAGSKPQIDMSVFKSNTM